MDHQQNPHIQPHDHQEGSNSNASNQGAIPAGDQSRKAERDQKIANEEDTARLRSERQSVQEGDQEHKSQ